MWPVSDRFLDALKSDHVVATKLEVLEGEEVIADLTALGTFVDGSVSKSRGEVEASGSFTLVDRDGTLTPRDINDLLVPAGNQVRFWRGVMFNKQGPGGEPDIELAPVATMRFSSSSSTYPTVQLSDCFDRAWVVQRAKLPFALNILKGTPIHVGAAMLLQTAYPGLPMNFPDTGEVTNGMLFDVEADPWVSAQQLWANVGMRLSMDPMGVATALPEPDAGDPVVAQFVDEWDPDLIPGSNLAMADIELKWVGTGPNEIIVIGENSDLPAPVRAVARDSDPLSPLRWGGKYGIARETIRDEKVASVAQAQARATWELESRLGLVQSLSINTIVNPAWAVSDLARVLIYRRLATDDPPIREHFAFLEGFTVPGRASTTQGIETRARRVVVLEPNPIFVPEPVPEPPPPASRFPGDPGANKVYSGATVWPGTVTNAPPGNDAHLWLSNATGREHALRREYSSVTSGYSLGQVDAALNLGQLPLHTAKFENWTAAQVEAGSADSAMTTFCTALKQPSRSGKAVWLGYYHEPEDQFATAAEATQFRETFRYIVNFFRAQNVTNVAWNAAMFMCDWTYGGSGRKWWWWDPDWKGTLSGGGGTIPAAADWWTGTDSVVDIYSFDQYSPTIGSTTYRTFTSNFDTMWNAIVAAQRPVKPFVIGEMGTKTYTEPSTTWATHWTNAHAYFLAHNVVGVTYYNTNLNNFMDDPTGPRYVAYNNWVHRTEVLDANQIVF